MDRDLQFNKRSGTSRIEAGLNELDIEVTMTKVLGTNIQTPHWHGTITKLITYRNCHPHGSTYTRITDVR